MSNKSRRLYVGFTDNLAGRVVEHREKLFPGSFTARCMFDMLVFYEEYSHVISAKMREKEIKGLRVAAAEPIPHPLRLTSSTSGIREGVSQSKL